MSDRTAFVLVHGAHHNHSCWAAVQSELEARGHPVVAIDLPGAGENAAIPSSYTRRPLDVEAFATEPSPNAGVTQDERTEAVISAVRSAAELGDGSVVLMGHSLGGLTIAPVVEAIPDEVDAVAFLAAFMLPNGMPAGAVIEEELAESELPPLFMSDPAVTGALRLDTASPDPDYRAKLRSAFYNDLTDGQFEAAMSSLHPDEPAQVAGVPSNITGENFGSVDRHYIVCNQDNTILPAAQRKMVELVDASLGGSTTVHEMQTSHSPMVSDPAGLADILVSIAG